MLVDKLINLLQICDSGFPTGGFAHSTGLEVALKVGTVNNADDLKEYLLCCLENTGSFCLPFMREAYQLYKETTSMPSTPENSSLRNLDQQCEACTPNHVANRASTRQGRSLMDTSIRVFDDSERLEELSQSLRYKHFPVVFGAVCAFLDVDLQAVSAAFLYSCVRTVIASAVRLDKVGPIQAQTIQTAIQKEIPNVVERYKQCVGDDACMIYPHLDIIQNLHDTMFSKLFYS